MMMKWHLDRSDLPMLVGFLPLGQGSASKFEVKPKDFTIENLTEFAKSVYEGKIQPIKILSEPIPESNDGPILKLVGDNFR
jgi:hypothetical protein